MFRRTETIKFSEFMSGEYKDKKVNKRANRLIVATSSTIPLIAFTPKALAAPSCPPTITVSSPHAVPVGIGETVGNELISSLAHLFDPLIQLIIGISFPVASAMILFKLFMGFFVGQDQVWEGIGKTALVYVLIQMFPVFSQILKNLGSMV
jgi:hypothetical protein